MSNESPAGASSRSYRWKVRLMVYGGLFAAFLSFVVYCTSMPGSSAEKFDSTTVDRETAKRLETTVDQLVEIGPRNLLHATAYRRARDFLSAELAEITSEEPTKEIVSAPQGDSFNLIHEWGPSEGKKLFVVGAHYDTALTTPGGNDNGSGVAVGLELARRFQAKPPEGRIRIVLFANEEPPHFWTDEMGSLVHAQGCKERGEEVIGMISLETLGFYSREKESQKYPPPVGLLYPSQGNYVAFVGNVSSRSFVADSVRVFRGSVQFPSEGAALPGSIPGIGWSDHWSFWQVGYPALMVTDTSPFRDRHYHQESDKGKQIDFDRLAVVTDGVEAVVRQLVAKERS